MSEDLMWSAERGAAAGDRPAPAAARAEPSPVAGGRRRFGLRHRWLERLLERVEAGTLALRLPDGSRSTHGRGEPAVDLSIDDWRACAAVLRRGDVGFAEAYIDGHWNSSDPARLIAFLLRNRAAAERAIYGSALGGLAYRIAHWLRSNTRAQARRNIVAHYDLGNAFYALWLDPSMTYSSALFDAADDPHEPATLEALQRAQQAKYRRVLHELDLAPGASVLEIGCGWGGFAEHAARAGMRTTALTLSPAQLGYASNRLGSQGLFADLQLRDYRDERARYDAIASIEMFEAVGERYWPAYFDTLARCLRPGGRACIQTITIDDALFERYRRGTDFIQQYVFPGGMLPSPGAFEAQAARAGLKVLGRHAFGAHYARTLATWRARFTEALPRVRELGFDDRFVRLWTLYLAYCEGAFAQRSTDVVQYTLAHR